MTIQHEPARPFGMPLARAPTYSSAPTGKLPRLPPSDWRNTWSPTIPCGLKNLVRHETTKKWAKLRDQRQYQSPQESRLVSPHEFQNLFAEGACAFCATGSRQCRRYYRVQEDRHTGGSELCAHGTACMGWGRLSLRLQFSSARMCLTF